MRIKAAIVSEKSGPFVIGDAELCEPRRDELIVRVVASGMCQTDLHGRDGYYASPYPGVYGHEGAGVVHAAVSYTHLDVYKRQAESAVPPVPPARAAGHTAMR